MYMAQDSDCGGSVGKFVVYRPLLHIFFSLGVLKYVVCLCKGCNGCCVFCLYCEAVGDRVWEV